ncbi:MAG: 23S rRNA (guanosine(2251)-2'-O)-methyltransferase RlmB [Kiritimatiellia bacterium]
MPTEFLYGRRPIFESLRAGRRRHQRLILSETLKKADLLAEIQELARARDIPVKTVGRSFFDEHIGDVNHQSVALETSPYPYVDIADILARVKGSSEPAFILLLDHLQDPQNLGSILRTAEAAGVHGVIIPERRAVEVTPSAVRASAGASEHMAVARVVNLVNAMNGLKEDGLWLAGLDAGPDSVLYTAADLKGAVGLVIGAEGEGLGRLVGETCDYRIRLPMQGQVASLNAGVASGIAMYEVRRLRDAAASAKG